MSSQDAIDVHLPIPSFSQFKERYKDHKVPIASIKTIQNADVQQAAEKIYQKLIDADDLRIQRPFKEAAEVAAAADDGDEAVEDTDTPSPARKRRLRKPKDINYDDANELRHMCFPVADLIPPVPQKGTFDVSKIKKSLYFFS